VTHIDDVFYIENIKKSNNIVFKFICAMNAVPAAFLVLIVLHVFEIPLLQVFGLLILTLGFTIVDAILLKKDSDKSQNIAKYVSILCVNAMVCYVGCNPNIQISIVFALCPIISCLYFDSKFTRNTAILSYILMVISMFIKSFGIVHIMNYKNRLEPMAWFIPEITGLTMQYAFACILAWMFTQQTQDSLRHVFILNEEIDDKNTELKETQFKIIQFVAQVLGSHDLFTGRHVIHTQRYVEMICYQLRDNGYYTEELTDEKIKLFASAAFLHDIGKIHIPEGVLNKVGKFSEEEFSVMQHHPEEGKKLLQFLPPVEDGQFNQIAIEMAFNHHEKWDGSGYPENKKGEEIPLCARIMAAADVLDALVSRRLYKEPMSIDEAMAIFEKAKGTQFEECIAEAVIQCRDKINAIDMEFKKLEEETNVQELEWWKKYSSASIRSIN